MRVKREREREREREKEKEIEIETSDKGGRIVGQSSEMTLVLGTLLRTHPPRTLKGKKKSVVIIILHSL
jgi:proteasome assembly chaperone (PAC2) family protein